MKKSLILPLVALCSSLLTSCGKGSTLDESLQAAADSLARTELATSQSDSAVVVVMAVRTGEVKAQLKLVKNFVRSTFDPASEVGLDKRIEPGPIFIPLAVMGAMDEGGLSLTNPVDAGKGLLVLHQRSIYDQEVYGKGGYGLIDLGRCVTLPSMVGVVKTLEEVYDGKVERFETRMKKMSLGMPADSNVFDETSRFESMMNAFSVGYYFKISPTQLLTQYSALANKGQVLAPLYTKGEPIVVNPAMCSAQTVQAMQELLAANGAALMPEVPGVALMRGYMSSKNTYKRETSIAFAGYFPVSDPQYACLVKVYRAESPDTDPAPGKEAVEQAGRRIFAGLAQRLMP